MHMSTGSFTSFDQYALFYRQWQNPDKTKTNSRILILLHRGHEHSARLQTIAEEPAFADYTIYSYDNRGHGQTKLAATYEFMDLVRDLDYFVKFVCDQEAKKPEDIFIIANSVAGVVASTWVHDYAPNICGMALVAPAFKIKLYFPYAKMFLKAFLKFSPKLNIRSYVKSRFLTHNIDEQKKYDADEFITPNIPAMQLTTLLDTAERVVVDAQFITVPTLVLSADSDYVVDSKIQGDFYARLSSPLKQFVNLKGFYHGVLYEQDKAQAIAAIADFLPRCFEQQQQTESQTEQMIKHAQQEFDQIAYGSLPAINSLNYFVQRMMMRYVGHISEGMKIGKQYGFDSGVTLDYVYKNQAQGQFGVGEMIDRNYLDSIGWQGIRQRKVHMIETVSALIEQLQQQNQAVKILDVAGGPARYLADIAQQYPNIEVQVRDYQQQNIEQGQQLAKELALDNIHYQQRDAFDATHYNRDEYAANIVIISGFFELFGDNALIEKTIAAVSELLEQGAHLIYTGQPWHPQLEMIANVLGNHQQQAWIMRRRSQYELDRVFAKYGFKKQQMRIDNWGIFTVSHAILER